MCNCYIHEEVLRERMQLVLEMFCFLSHGKTWVSFSQNKSVLKTRGAAQW